MIGESAAEIFWPMANPNDPTSASKEKSRAQSKRGVAKYWPWLLVLVLVPVAVWLALRFFSGGAKKETSSSAHAGDQGPEGTKKAKQPDPPASRAEILAAPLTRVPIGFHTKKYLGHLAIMQVNGDAVGPAEPDTIRVNVANNRGTQLLLARVEVVSNVLIDVKRAIEDERLIAARLSVRGDHHEFLARLNTSRNQLLDITSSMLSSKTLDDLGRPGAQDQIRMQLLREFNAVLGAGTLDDVRFVEFEIRRR